MKSAVIVDCCRTPIGRAHPEKGVFRDVRSDDLAVAVVRRWSSAPASIRPKSKTSCSATRNSNEEQGFNVARIVSLMAGLPSKRAGRRSTGSAAAACRRSTRPATRSSPAARTCRSSAAWSTCTTCRWTRRRLQPQAVSRHQQRRAAHGHHGRVPRPDAGHLARSAGQVRLAQSSKAAAAPQAGDSTRDRSRLGSRRSGRAVLVDSDQCIRPDYESEALAALEPAFMPGSAPSRRATVRR